MTVPTVNSNDSPLASLNSVSRNIKGQSLLSLNSVSCDFKGQSLVSLNSVDRKFNRQSLVSPTSDKPVLFLDVSSNSEMKPSGHFHYLVGFIT